jgi:hypothetical protein
MQQLLDPYPVMHLESSFVLQLIFLIFSADLLAAGVVEVVDEVVVVLAVLPP